MLVLVLIDIALVGAYVFLYGSIGTWRLAAGEAGVAISMEQAKQENSAVLRKSIRDTEAVRAALDTRYVETGEVPAFLEAIEALAGKTGAEVAVRSVDVEPLGSASASTTEYLVVAVHGEGSFKQIIGLTRLLESIPQASMTSNLALRTSASSEKKTGPRWQLDMSFKVLKKK